MNKVKYYTTLGNETSWYDPYRSHKAYNNVGEDKYEYLEKFWVEDVAYEFAEYGENLDAFGISKEQIQDLNHD